MIVFFRAWVIITNLEWRFDTGQNPDHSFCKGTKLKRGVRFYLLWGFVKEKGGGLEKKNKTRLLCPDQEPL